MLKCGRALSSRAPIAIVRETGVTSYLRPGWSSLLRVVGMCNSKCRVVVVTSCAGGGCKMRLIAWVSGCLSLPAFVFRLSSLVLWYSLVSGLKGSNLEAVGHGGKN